MVDDHEYNPYIASWEYMYLLPNGIPGGLPNQLFSKHPWLPIIFETLYCDENGFKAEQNAANQMKWVNSELFVRLTHNHNIIRPMNINTRIRQYKSDLEDEFIQEHGKSIVQAVREDLVTVDELFDWRIKLIRPFLDEHKFLLYDWDIVRHTKIPKTLNQAVNNILLLNGAAVPLTRDLKLQLSPEKKSLFEDLQNFEREPLNRFRRGQMSQQEYLGIIAERRRDYSEVDLELIEGVDQNLEQILRLRERFGNMGGWKLVKDFLRAYDQDASPRDLSELNKEIQEHMLLCFKPMLKEFGLATMNIAKGLVSLLPYVGPTTTIIEKRKSLKNFVGLSWESIKFFLGKK